MSQVIDLGGGRKCALPSLDHLDSAICLYQVSGERLYYAVDGCFYLVFDEFEETEDGDEITVYDVRELARWEAEEFLTDAFGAEEAARLLNALREAERGEPRPPVASLQYLTMELGQIQKVDLRRANEEARAEYGVKVEKIWRLMDRVFGDLDRAVEDPEPMDVLPYDVQTLYHGSGGWGDLRDALSGRNDMRDWQTRKVEHDEAMKRAFSEPGIHFVPNDFNREDQDKIAAYFANMRGEIPGLGKDGTLLHFAGLMKHMTTEIFGEERARAIYGDDDADDKKEP